MSDLDALLEGIVSDPSNALRWLVMADWLEEHGQPERAELVRVHRELLRTCTATRETKARKQLHARMMELMRAGVQPCLPQRTITLPGGVEMRFSFIPPGSFLMGSPRSEAERCSDERRHLVTLTKGFWMAQTPVTEQQWVAVMGYNPSHFKGETLPVDSVSWDDTQAYLAEVKRRIDFDLRLPSEAEWEYTARAGTTTPFHWGEVLNGAEANCDGKWPYGTAKNGPNLKKTTTVERYNKMSPHPWMLTATVGNVWEWCADWKVSYPTGGVTDPVGPRSGAFRVRRGGCWAIPGGKCRSAYRTGLAPDNQNHYDGFRLAADLSALA